MFGKSGFGIGALAAVSFFVLTAPAANAVMATFQITSDHCDGGCLGGLSSLGTVTVNDNGGNGTITFTVDVSATGSTIINTGFDGSFAFDLLDNPVITYSGLTAGFSPVGGNSVGAQNLTQFDGFGTFEYAVLRDAQGGGSGLPILSFTISDAADNLTLGSLEQKVFASGSTFFVTDVMSGVTGNTGLVDASVGTCASNCGGQNENIPEPTSFAILGTALASLCLIGRRRKRLM
jgi:hypothetical protein